MGESRLSVNRRLRWVVLFAAAFLTISAIPVIAAEPSAPPREIVLPQASKDIADPSMRPGTEDITGAIEKAEAEEEKRKAWLRSPEAIQERENSRFAFAGLNAASAEELLRTNFADVLAQLNRDPARFLSDAQLLSTSEPTAATVKDEGDGMLFESSLPIRVKDEEGDLRKVDLSLEETSSGFETENALVDVQIPESVGQPIEVGDEGVAIKLAGADEASPARPFGDENTFAAEVLPDTDMLVSPIATGVEIFNVLRSENSPETFRFQVKMPAGAELRADGGWGAAVVKDGKRLTTIPEPIAVDAQGTDVPVELEIEDDTFTLVVDHREGDYAMPILLDPILEDGSNWYLDWNLETLNNWGYGTNVGSIYGSTYCIYQCFYGNGRALYVSAQSGGYWQGQWGQWGYSAPNIHSYLKDVTLAPYNHFDHNCSEAQYPQPHNYFGIWSRHGYWVYVSVNSANQPGNTYTLPHSGDAAVFGLGFGSAGYYSIPCWRDLRAGGSHIWLDDWGYPSVYSVQDPATHWIGPAHQVNVIAQASDEGLGVQNVRINSDGANTIHHIPPQDQCSGTRRDPCLTGHTATFNLLGSDLREGRRVAAVTAHDPTGKGSNAYYFETKMDATAPQAKLKGQLAVATEDDVSEEQGDAKEEKLRLPVYRLTIEAADGIPGSDEKQWRSGVESIELLLDGQPLPDGKWAPGCATHSCSLTKTYSLALSGLTTAGHHVLKVLVKDEVGNERVRSIEFEYFPATGMKDEYVMHYFPLPDGQGNEAEEEHPDRPELAVNVMNGNLVYRQQDIEVEGPAVDLEVERYYNSQLPDSENTEWGDGWTLAQTPDLEPVDTGGSPAPDEAQLLESSGAIEEEIELPTETGAEEFDPALQATLTKTSGGGFEMTDETGESATSVVFDETGQAEALMTEGFAKVDYTYEGGELAEIAVEDPGSAAYPPGYEPEQAPDGPPAYATAFGSYGTGNGQFDRPGEIAIAPDGDIWVADTYNHRIQHFDSNGNYIGKFGSTGNGNGQFNRPRGIEFDAEGNFWVLDSLNNRLQKFNDEGEYLSKWGVSGTSNGKLKTPKGFTIDAEGNFWIADTLNARIQKFAPNGTFLKVAGTSGPGDLAEPLGISTGPEGEVFVADWTQNRVVVFDSEGEYERAFGAEGEGDGEFGHPVEVEVDSLDNVWVGDELNQRVQQFDTQGNYIAQFGDGGDDEGEMDPISPLGITTDAEGSLWLTDTGNDRVQKWVFGALAPSPPIYAAAFGSEGTGNGQLDRPGDVAVAPDGNIWVADTDNDRVQHFDSEGTYIGKFGSTGTENDQFESPRAIEFDAEGNIWVLDSLNERVKKFNEAGEYLTKWGAFGSSNGQLNTPKGLAIDADGNFWIADTANDRIQKFTSTGTFLEVAGTSGPGELSNPVSLDVSPEGEVFVVDRTQNRVVVFDSEGEYERAFGTEGDGNGELDLPLAIDVNAWGNVWVGDELNKRVQQFDTQGNYVAQFGAEGSGEGEMDPISPMGITTDDDSIWLTDSGNGRVQRWEIATPPPTEEELLADDPEVQVEVADDLVTGIVGDEAGEHTYAHEGNFLISHDGPQGETLYEEEEDRLTKITLPNGTWAEIDYYADGRVSDVTIDPAGSDPEKTTHFAYTEEPRQTLVYPPDDPRITYVIGDDGSVLKWWNTEEPPTIEPFLGTLYTNRETANPISAGAHLLTINTWSAEGIASIQVIANGNQLVDEITCEEDLETETVDCEELVNEWVTETGSHAPGILHIEVLVTDHKGNVASERFWVNIPQPPPSSIGAPEEPKFNEVKQFREDYGLEIIFPVKDETELNERIFNLIGAWNNPGSPAGQVARASWERWGVPLRPEDVAELEYRNWYVSVNGELIEAWGRSHHPESYAGYFVDHRAGGIMSVGFNADQANRLASLKSQLPLEAAQRLASYQTAPAHALQTLDKAHQDLLAAVEENSTLASFVTELGVERSENTVRVGTSNVVETEAVLDGIIDPQAPVTIFYEPDKGELISGRFRTTGRMRAGDGIYNEEKGLCTAGFGAYENRNQKNNREEIRARFLLGAGHCYMLDEEVKRPSSAIGAKPLSKLGQVTRNAYLESHPLYPTDVLAVRVKTEGVVPRDIYGSSGNGVSVKKPAIAGIGALLCYSGAKSNHVSCGHVSAITPSPVESRLTSGPPVKWIKGYRVKFKKLPIGSDSGSPVWNPSTGASIGLATGVFPKFGYAIVTPLLPHPQLITPGILNVPGMDKMHIITDG